MASRSGVFGLIDAFSAHVWRTYGLWDDLSITGVAVGYFFVLVVPPLAIAVRIARHRRRAREIYNMDTYGYVRPKRAPQWRAVHYETSETSGYTDYYNLTEGDAVRYARDLAYVRQKFGPDADGRGNFHTKGNALPITWLEDGPIDPWTYG